MSKKTEKVEDFEVEVKTKKVRAKVKKEAKKVDVEVDTPKVDVEVHTDKETKEKHFKLDSEKLDVEVNKTEAGTEVVVNAENGLLKRIGNFFGKLVSRKFNKDEVQK